MTRTLSLSEVKIKFSHLVDGVVRKDDEVLITRNGRTVAVLLSADIYDSWKETQEIKANSALMQEIKKGVNALQKGLAKKYSSLDELFKS